MKWRPGSASLNFSELRMRYSHAAALAAQPTTTPPCGVAAAACDAAQPATYFVPSIARGIARRFYCPYDAAPCAFPALRRRQQSYACTENRTHGQPRHEVQRASFFFVVHTPPPCEPHASKRIGATRTYRQQRPKKVKWHLSCRWSRLEKTSTGYS